MTASSIEQLLGDLLMREGGYVDHPADRGGPTNFGITEQVARAFGFSGSMRDLPRTLALRIYRERYWLRSGFGDVATRLPKLADELFDTGVNMGPKVAAVFLQRALNALNRGAVEYPDIVADGDIGMMTLAAIDALIARRGAKAAETVLLRAVDSLQAGRYISIAEANPSQEAFVWGWIANRVGVAG